MLTCEKLNISAAGRVLGMAPAVASSRIAKLEKRLGADLFHRSTRKLSISTEGQDFLPYAQEILAQEQSALAALGNGREKISGTLRFAAPSSFAEQYIAPILPHFMDLYPKLFLDLHLSDAQFDLIEGRYDLTLRNSELNDSSLTVRKLADDRRVLCASPEYLRKYGAPKQANELAEHRLIAFRSLKPRSLITPDGNQTEFNPKQAHSYLVLNDGQSQKRLTLSGGGVSVNSLWLVHNELKDGSLVRVLPNHELADNPALWLLYPKSTILSPKVRVFIDFLLEQPKTSHLWQSWLTL